MVLLNSYIRSDYPRKTSGFSYTIRSKFGKRAFYSRCGNCTFSMFSFRVRSRYE